MRQFEYKTVDVFGVGQSKFEEYLGPSVKMGGSLFRSWT